MSTFLLPIASLDYVALKIREKAFTTNVGGESYIMWYNNYGLEDFFFFFDFCQ